MKRLPAPLGASILGLLLVVSAASCGGQPPKAATSLTVHAPGELAGLASSLAAGFNGEQRAISVTIAVVLPRQVEGAVLSNTGSLAITYALPASAPLSQTVFALDPVAVGVALTNPVGALTLSQVRSIFTGAVGNWTELGGRDVPVTPLVREEGALSRAAFDQWALGGGARLTRNAQVLSTDRGMVASLEAMDGGIGYALLRSLTPNVRPLRLDGEPPSAAAVQQGRYPLVLPVAAVSAGAQSEGVRAFIAYLRGRSGQAVIQTAGLVAAR